MNTSTARARAIVEWVIDAGATHVVVAPGSRSAPLSWAFAQADEAQAIELHVRIDERDAGFYALGIAKATGQPVAVLVTSGSAVANLLPAVVEAWQSGIPLVVLTADRPAAVRGLGAAQTINQVGIFSSFTQGSVDLGIDDDINDAMAHIFEPTTFRGPLHLNVQFDLPLMPDSAHVEWEPLKGLHEVSARESRADSETFEVPAHGLMIVGDVANLSEAQAASALADTLGWPVIWEPSANAHTAPTALAHGPLLLADPHALQADMIITVGTVGLSRSVMRSIKVVPEHIAVHLNSAGPDIPDPVRSASRILNHIPLATAQVDPEWLHEWRRRDSVAQNIVQQTLSPNTLTGPSAALILWDHAGENDQLFVAASWPVRHLEAYAPVREGLRVFGNRGANGIDGLISSALGVASNSDSRTYLLIGDVAFLHDVGGLNVPDDQVHPNLTIVVLDNDGGGIFSQLEQGAPAYARHYERIFGTPHGRDLWVIAESFGIPARRVTTKSELASGLMHTDAVSGLHVIVCTTGAREHEMELIESIQSRINESLDTN